MEDRKDELIYIWLIIQVINTFNIDFISLNITRIIQSSKNLLFQKVIVKICYLTALTLFLFIDFVDELLFKLLMCITILE